MRSNAFLGRESELASLEATWQQAAAGSPQLAVVWGRRRVGKTFLLAHFAQGRRAVFFGATQQNERIELDRLAEAARRDLGASTMDLASCRLTLFATISRERSGTSWWRRRMTDWFRICS